MFSRRSIGEVGCLKYRVKTTFGKKREGGEEEVDPKNKRRGTMKNKRKEKHYVGTMAKTALSTIFVLLSLV